MKYRSYDQYRRISTEFPQVELAHLTRSVRPVYPLRLVSYIDGHDRPAPYDPQFPQYVLFSYLFQESSSPVLRAVLKLWKSLASSYDSYQSYSRGARRSSASTQ